MPSSIRSMTGQCIAFTLPSARPEKMPVGVLGHVEFGEVLIPTARSLHRDGFGLHP
jgi:hypothetical protein